MFNNLNYSGLSKIYKRIEGKFKIDKTLKDRFAEPKKDKCPKSRPDPYSIQLMEEVLQKIP